MQTKSNSKRTFQIMKANWELYLLLIIPITYFIVFKYMPIYGAQIAFRDYNIVKGFDDSPFVGLKYFKKFIDSYQFESVIFNTLSISIYDIFLGFPVPIILALLLNYCKNARYKKIVQMVTYAPHFISSVVICGIIIQLLAPRIGLVNIVINKIGLESISFLDNANYFSSIFVWSGIWQQMGWASIIYIAALSGVDPQLHEAAKIDGATILKRIWHVDIPAILPTIVIMLILRFGRVMTVGFEKVLLLQTPANISRSEIISTYVYKIGLASGFPNYSYSSAIGLFLSVINFILLITVNTIAKKVKTTTLW